MSLVIADRRVAEMQEALRALVRAIDRRKILTRELAAADAGNPTPLPRRSTTQRCTTPRVCGTMPAEARGHVRKLPSGKWQLRYYDAKGGHRSGGAFSSKTEALNHYRDVIEPELNGRPVARRDLTYSELVEVFLERHAIVAKPRTITELRWRLKRPRRSSGRSRSPSSRECRTRSRATR